MNITGGKFNGRKITTVKSNDVRPTSSKVRSSIFNMLKSLGINFEESTFLDLFAGSGIMGLEALSRGVSKSFFVEKNNNIYKVINQNLINFDANFETFNMDALDFLDKTNAKFDIIFADPPYKSQLYDLVVEKVKNSNLLNPKGIFILETPLTYNIPSNIIPLKEKKYGETKIYFLEI
jgi:16S rRNA (guanine(966)-N(2))-methyltransferase RsmD